MKLGVSNRITLLRILPKEGNFITYSIIMDFKSKLPFSDDEVKEFGVQDVEGNKVGWITDGEVEIECNEKMIEIIILTLKDLDRVNKLDDGSILLYRKFILNNNI